MRAIIAAGIIFMVGAPLWAAEAPTPAMPSTLTIQSADLSVVLEAALYPGKVAPGALFAALQHINAAAAAIKAAPSGVKK